MRNSNIQSRQISLAKLLGAVVMPVLFVMATAIFTMQSAQAASPWIQQSNWPMPADSGAMAFGDLNGDGVLDLIFGHNDGTLTAYQNTGTNASPVWSAAPSSWTTVTSCSTGGAGSDWWPALADLDGDGRPDLVLGTTNQVCIYRNTGATPTQTAWTRMTTWETGLSGFNLNRHYHPTALADVDGDGMVDMLLFESNTTEHVLKNTGTGAAPNIVSAWTERTDWYVGQQLDQQSGWGWADLDGDGKVDRLTASGNYVYMYPNSGTATAPSWPGYANNWSLFPPGASVTTISTDNQLKVADLNGDGRPDLLLLTASGMTVYYQSASGMGTPQVLSGTSATGVVNESFDSFTCTGTWQLVSGNYYKKDCGNGWTAFSGSSSDSGNSSTITVDTVNGPSASSSTPASSPEMYTSTTNSVRTKIWLLKSFPVQAGGVVSDVKADARIRIDSSGGSVTPDNYGVVVFDGVVTDPSAVTALGQNLAYDGNNTSSSDACYLVALGGWCNWQQGLSTGTLYPTQSYITVGLYLNDVGLNQTDYAEFDNLSVSNVVLAASSTVTNQDQAVLWSATYQAGGTDNGAMAADSVTDSSGNTYVAGTFNNGTNYDIVVLKYDNTGALVAGWPVTYDGVDDDEAVSIVLDQTGDIDVIGRSYNGSNNDYTVLKYTSSGALSWSATYDNAGKDDIPTSLAADSSGNVYVTGRSCGSTGCDYATVKFNAVGGSQAWVKTYDSSGDDRAVAIKLDNSNNAYVTGTSVIGSDDIVTIKYNSTGAQMWETRYDSGASDRATQLAVDPSTGDSYIAGYTYGGDGLPTLLLLKYDTNGVSPIWIKGYSSASGKQTLPTAMILDSAGNIYLTGEVGSPGDYDILTLKYLNNGSLVWAQAYGNSGLNDYGVDLALDTHGYVYVLGSLTQVTGNPDYVTVKYDTSSGVATSAATYDGSTLSDAPASLTLGVDIQGDTTAYVVGTSEDYASRLQVIKVLGYEKALPDLTMTQLTPPSLAPIGGNIDVTNVVNNVADLANKIYADSGSFTVSFYLAPAATPTDLSNLIGTRIITNLAPGTSSSDATSLTIPSGTIAGSYVLVAVADSGGVVTEANEANNSITSATFSVGASDLQVNSVSSADTAMTRGTSYTVSTSVQNIGGYDTPAGTSFRVGIYLSTDNVITTSDILIGSRTISSLASTAIDTADTLVTIPSGMGTGSYYLGAIVDDQNTVVETNETNNTGIYYLAGNSVILDTDTDFNPGLSVTGVYSPGAGMPSATTGIVVNGTGTPATIVLDKDTTPGAVAWGSPSPAWTAPLAVTYMESYAFGDLTGNNIPDMVVGVSSLSTPKVYGYSNSSSTSPTWTRESTWDLTGVCGGGSGTSATPVLVDLDGDGLKDLVVGTEYHMCIYKNTGTSTVPAWTRADGTTAGIGNWESGLPSASGTAYGYFAPAAADLDGDGYPDLMIGTYSTSDVKGYKFSGINSGTGDCNAATCWTLQSAWYHDVYGINNKNANPTLADIDGDGRVDMLVGTVIGGVEAYQNVCTLPCSSGPVWTAGPGSWVPPSPGNTIVYPSLANLVGSSTPELVLGTSSNKYLPYVPIAPYLSTGTYFSTVQDAGSHGGYTGLAYSSAIPTNTTLDVYARAGDVSTPDATWTSWVGPIAPSGDISSLGTNRYIQFRITLGTTSAANGKVTPDVDSIQAYTNPATGPTQAISITVGGGSSGGGELSISDLIVLSFFFIYINVMNLHYRAMRRSRASSA